MEFSEVFEKSNQIKENLSKILKGKDEVVDLTITALLSGGHLLIEDVPGVGKTTLAGGLAKSLDLNFQRIQFTSDLLPSDIIGVTIYNDKTKDFEFKEGPIFSNIVLADEINRTTPKTQSALLEAMNEKQVSVDRKSHKLPEPFMIMATQNPTDHRGTYDLPESQLDRFTMRITIGYPDEETEIDIIKSPEGHSELNEINHVLSKNDIVEMQQAVESVTITDEIIQFIQEIVTKTRQSEQIILGVSPRGAKTMFKSAKAYALVKGRDFVIPQDIKDLAVPVFSHRIITGDGYGDGTGEIATSIIEELVETITVPL